MHVGKVTGWATRTGRGCGLPRARMGVAKSPPATNPHPWRGLPKPAAGCLSRHRGGRGFPLFDISNIHLSIRVVATHGNMSPLQVTAVLLQLRVNACQLRERTNTPQSTILASRNQQSLSCRVMLSESRCTSSFQSQPLACGTFVTNH
jgi:hypothetical protein